MKLGPNIARNAALKENIFMMVICIELRIPLFLIGKPGSSKSLAKSIIASSMLGKSSECGLMREMKAVQSYIDIIKNFLFFCIRFKFFPTSVVSCQLQKVLLKCLMLQKVFKTNKM